MNVIALSKMPLPAAADVNFRVCIQKFHLLSQAVLRIHIVRIGSCNILSFGQLEAQVQGFCQSQLRLILDNPNSGVLKQCNAFFCAVLRPLFIHDQDFKLIIILLQDGPHRIHNVVFAVIGRDHYRNSWRLRSLLSPRRIKFPSAEKASVNRPLYLAIAHNFRPPSDRLIGIHPAAMQHLEQRVDPELFSQRLAQEDFLQKQIQLLQQILCLVHGKGMGIGIGRKDADLVLRKMQSPTFKRCRHYFVLQLQSLVPPYIGCICG